MAGTPLQPMLGTITRSLDEVFTRLGSTPFQSEAKLDGQRGQIHVSLVAPDGESTGKGRYYEPKEGELGTKIWCRIFSRHLEDSTGMFPDILPTLSVSRSHYSLDFCADFGRRLSSLEIQRSNHSFSTPRLSRSTRRLSSFVRSRS